MTKKDDLVAVVPAQQRDHVVMRYTLIGFNRL